MARKFYTVQVGDDFSSDYGSTNYRNALVIAHEEARNNPDKEVRICVCTTNDDFALDVNIIQEGDIS